MKRPQVAPHRLSLGFRFALTAGGLTLCLVAVAGCRSTPPAKPLDQLNPVEAQGHEVFRERCSACHYDRSSKPFHGPGLGGMFRKPYLPSGAPANDDRVTATIRNGRGMMPPQPEIDSQELDELLAYLHTL